MGEESIAQPMSAQPLSPFNVSYVGIRKDVLRLVPPASQRVLDVGCSVGALGEQIKLRTGATVEGIELDFQMAQAAQSRIDRVVVGNVEELPVETMWPAAWFDCMIFADVLEHLRDPWTVLQRFTTLLQPGGVVIVSMPNIGHISTIGNLLFRQYWPYRERGIHDRTHLRFFTLRNMHELLASAGLDVIAVQRNYRFLDQGGYRLNRAARFLGFPPFRELVAYQYLVVGRRPRR
jgi:2-polyprenyl-3-methyl-5-hydroxy-6-metoxy-1,4-benzoquinol methylase